MRDPMEIFEDVLSKHFPKLYKVYMKYNFCKGEYADGTAKPESKAFNIFSRVFYLECSCCAVFRGMMAGAVLGFIVGTFF